MNLSKPINLVLVGSIFITLITFITLLFVGDVDTLTYIWLPLLIGGLTFGTFTFIIERFLNKKIQLIHRIISNKKLDKESSHANLSQDALGNLQRDAVMWVRTQQEQIKELESKAAFRREFLGNLAHELKTPVFSIQGYILTLLEGGLEDEKVNRDFLERALNGVERISHILTDLDEISRYEFDRYNLKNKKFDIVSLAKTLFKELENKGSERNIKFVFDKSYEPIQVMADEGKISQVLTNLINNSIAYGTDNGTTTIRFHNLDKNKVLVEVADDGSGIDEAHLPRLFERFYRVDKSRARNIGGSGLGLAIVKHIMEAHGQSINVRSTVGVGSTFSFTLDKAKS